MALEWITSEGYIGSIKRDESPTKLSIYAEDSDNDYIVKYTFISGDLPYGLSLNSDGTFSGKCQTSEIIDNKFSVQASSYDNDTLIESISGEFYITSNPISDDDAIIWNDDENFGSYKCGETISKQFNAYCVNTTDIKYMFASTNYPQGLNITSDGSLYGTIEPQELKEYSFDIIALTSKATLTKTFKIIINKGLGKSATNCYLKLNHTNDDFYDDLLEQLDITDRYKFYDSKYNINQFPRIDVAKLHCFDRELLSWLSGVRSENIETMVRVTLNPFPADSEVTLTCDGYEQEVIDDVKQNYILVPINSTIHWQAKYGDKIKEGNAIAVNHLTLNVDVVERRTITIIPAPSDATVILKSEGYVQEGNSIVVPDGAEVVYYVYKEKYNSVIKKIIIDGSQDIEVTLGLVIKDVDHLVVKIKFTDGRDLDTGTFFANISNIPDLQDKTEKFFDSTSKGVGYLARQISSKDLMFTPTDKASASITNCVLAFCGDNTNIGDEQYESIYLNAKNLKEKYGSQLPEEVQIKLYSYWWGAIGYNNPVLSAIGYTGGYMSYKNYVFYNIDGKEAGNITDNILNMDTKKIQSIRHVANIFWNTNTQDIRIEIIPKED